MVEFRPTLLLVCFLLIVSPVYTIRLFQENVKDRNKFADLFKEAPKHANADHCPKPSKGACDPFLIHVALTLDSKYLRGSIAAIHSILKHASCSENLYFHLIASHSASPSPAYFVKIMESTFPSLAFQVYPFDPNRVQCLISSSIRKALENPLNYARTYLADILEPCVNRVIYIDSDTITVDDIGKLWSTTLSDSRVIGAPQYCQVNFTKYFTDEFWSDRELPRIFEGKMPCYFNTGVMVMDLVKWREGEYTKKIEIWMKIQKERRIYDLGSLPPFLLVFGGNIEAIDHRWNQHGLGGDNRVHSCRLLHPGPVSLLHWSGKGKPWVRLDEGRHCLVDRLWAPYDLYRGNGLKHFRRSILDA